MSAVRLAPPADHKKTPGYRRAQAGLFLGVAVAGDEVAVPRLWHRRAAPEEADTCR